MQSINSVTYQKVIFMKNPAQQLVFLLQLNHWQGCFSRPRRSLAILFIPLQITSHSDPLHPDPYAACWLDPAGGGKRLFAADGVRFNAKIWSRPTQMAVPFGSPADVDCTRTKSQPDSTSSQRCYKFADSSSPFLTIQIDFLPTEDFCGKFCKLHCSGAFYGKLQVRGEFVGTNQPIHF